MSDPDISTVGSTNSSTSADRMRRVVTFYSYKGGVGRSMALANIGVILARDYGMKVLVVDWDLEAPGLHRYFNMSDSDLGEGVIDYLDNYKKLIQTPKERIRYEDLSIAPYLRKVYTYDGGGSLKLLGAGSQETKSSYVDKVRSFDWQQFYADWNGAQLIEALRNEFMSLAEITLIDSRTGITDVGGVCTVQLPDTVVFVFVFNQQNLTGIERVATDLSDEKNPDLAALKRKPELLFLPCRKELSELERLRKWENDAVETLGRFCETPKIKALYPSAKEYLRTSSVPYVSYYAYGEELAALSEKGYELVKSFKPLVELLISDESARLAVVKNRSERTRRRALAAVMFIGGISAIVLATLLITNLGASFGYTLFIKGAVAGILGASVGALTRLQLVAAENPWKLDSRYVWSRVVLDVIGGALFGAIASAVFRTYSYYLLLAVSAGFAWRPLVDSYIKALLGAKKA